MQDHVDALNAISATRADDAVHMLRDMAEIRAGFPDSSWSNVSSGAAHSASVVKIAASQLAKLIVITDLPKMMIEACQPEVSRIVKATEASHGWMLSPCDVSKICSKLHGLLKQPLSPSSLTSLKDLLSRLHEVILERPFCDAGSKVDIELPLLTACIVQDMLRRFLLANYELAYPPFGSPALLHAASRLSNGLGPYLAHVPYWLDGGRKVLGLIQLAVEDANQGLLDTDTIERWSVLLSQHMHCAALQTLVDEAADLGFVRTVWGIFDRVVRRSDAEANQDLLKRVRDCGIDNGDFDLARRAQREWARFHATEQECWIILGDLEAMDGDLRAAETAFLRVLDANPQHKLALDRLQAVREGKPWSYAVDSGYESTRFQRMMRSQRSLRGADTSL